MSKVCNLFIEKGSDFLVNVRVTGYNQQPLDLTGMTFKSQAKFLNDEYTKIDLKCDVDYPESGWFRLHLPYCLSEKMPVGEWHYDVEMSFNCGRRRLRILMGHITVTDQVTSNHYEAWVF